MKKSVFQTKFQDAVFALRQEKLHSATIPSSLEQCRKTGRIDAFKLQYAPGNGLVKPHYYWDSDVAKVMEGMAYCAELFEDESLAGELDELAELVVAAQQPDGYLNSCITVVENEKRFSNLFTKHELYCAGHLIEAAVAHFKLSGKRNFLDAMCRYADLIAGTFGSSPGQLRGYPGHQELELALCKLYDVTGNKRYLDLASFFIDERGREPNYYTDIECTANVYALKTQQAHLPVREQHEAVGHAVRALYMYCGMADVAVRKHDAALLRQCRELFDDIVKRKMFISGGVGATFFGEAFSIAYNLPNRTAYAESCAAMALVFFADRLYRYTGDAGCLDVIERVLYNAVLGGISLNGDEFFYANTLEMDTAVPEVKNVCRMRQKWFSVSCCPTSYCRFLPQLNRFCFDLDQEKLQINIPAAATFEAPGFAAELVSDYPYDGRCSLRIVRGGKFELRFRIPAWCKSYRASINGKSVTVPPENGFLKIAADWQRGDEFVCELDMPPHLEYVNPLAAENVGKAAVCRGPLVYCVESCDIGGDVSLCRLASADGLDFEITDISGLPAGSKGISFNALLMEKKEYNTLYSDEMPVYRKIRGVAIPYALRQNRSSWEMKVFLPFNVN